MKIKLLILIGMTVVPLLTMGQSTTPVFFNKGKMSVVGTNPDKTVLYVAGDFVASRDADDATVKSDIYLEGSKTVILGNFYQDAVLDDVTPGGTVLANVFSLPSDYFTGTKASKIEFRGTAAQKIGTRLTTKFNLGTSALKYSPKWKAANYINFPEIVVVNNKHVTIDPVINASVKGVDLQKGRLVLDSRRKSDATDEVGGGVHVEANSSILAHLYVDTDGNSAPATAIKYNRNPAATVDDYGAIDVKVAMDPTSPGGPTANRSIVGMGSPYEELKGDYFFWNFLMYPYGNNIFGYWNNTITDPTTTIYAGQGFVVGIDLRGTNAADYTPYQDSKYAAASFANRAKEEYHFGRFSYDNLNNYYPLAGMTNANSSFTAQTAAHAAYDKENLNYVDVKRKLVKGFNYLANPFTSPLDVSDLLVDYTTAPGTGTASDWTVTMGEESGDIYPYVWVLNPSSTAHSITGFPVGMEKLYANYTYFLLKNDGGTYLSSDADTNSDLGVSVEGAENIIAPLQMFLVYSHKEKPQANGITIPASKRVLKSGANFLRSTTEKAATEKWDDFVFEVADQTTKAYDRVAVVLRTADEIKNNASYIDVEKLLSSVTEADDVTAGNLRTVTEAGKVANTVNSVLYTADSKGTALESKFLAIPNGATEVSTPLYLSPSTTKQNIVIRAKRLETKEKVQSIFLKDKLTNKDFELSSGKDYSTAVNPTDSHDRFEVRFLFSPMGIEDEIDGDSDKTINSYYANGELIVSGFEESDKGSTISVYDIQGRMLKQVQVNELTMRISEVFYPGAYIVKVVGNKSYVSKFLVR